MEICLRAEASVWKKTSLNTGGVGGAGCGSLYIVTYYLLGSKSDNFQK